MSEESVVISFARMSRSTFIAGLMIAILASSLLLTMVATQWAIGPQGPKGGKGDEGPQGPAFARAFSETLGNGNSTGFEDVHLVSVVYNSSIMSYPDKNMSPYGPEVSPVYNLTKQALVYLNPENPDNPLSNIVMPGDVVVLKPNFVSPSGFAKEGCTRTPVLRPFVDFSVQAGASKVIIAEGSASPDPENVVFGPDYSNVTGLVQVLQEMYPSVNITYKNLNQDQFTWVDLGENSTFYGAYAADQLYSLYNIRMDEDSYYYAQDSGGYNPKGYRPGLYAIANTIFQTDVFIDVPKMKVHHLTGVTLSMKNLIGITVSSTGNTTNEESIKDIPHWNNTAVRTQENLTIQDSFNNDVVWRIMADLNKIVFYADKNGVVRSARQRRYLSVVDAVIGMEGPTVYNPPAIPRPTGVIVAGKNPAAVDAVCSRVMGFNYTVLRSITNMEKVSDHIFGKADPTVTAVLGTSLTNETFGESYVPHKNYKDSRIAPYKIRLQHFDPPEAEVIETYPETPREGVETKVIVYPQNVGLVAAGWLRYSLDGAGPVIIEMIPNGETLIGNLGLLEAGTLVSYEVCLQDYFFNTDWSDKMSIFVRARPYLLVRGLNDGIYYRGYGDPWGDWARLIGSTCDSPASAILNNTLHIVVRGFSTINVYANYSLWHGFVNLTDSSFSGWTRISGRTPSAPTLASDGSSLYLVVRGTNNRVYYNVWNGSWNDWTQIYSGRTTDGPAAVVLDGVLHVVVRGKDATSLWHGLVNLTDSSFYGWIRLSGATPSAPALVSDGSSLYVVVRGTNDGVYCNVWNGSWSDWTRVSGLTTDSPAAAVLNGALHIVVRGKNATSLWHGNVDLTIQDFSGWTKLSGRTPSAPTLTS